MKMALLRIGIDSGSGGIQGPLFQDGSFELICIPDAKQVDRRTYGNSIGRAGKPLVEYFPPTMRHRVMNQSIHVDPEFDTFTYGDPTPPKAGLRRLAPGDLLVFYAGLQGYDFESKPALYVIGYFEVAAAGRATDFTPEELNRDFSANFHVRHPDIFARQRQDLILIKGAEASRLLRKAQLISCEGRDRTGKPLKVLSSAMQEIFGTFCGRISIQRSPTRWVDPKFVSTAVAFVRSLE
jgi:putative DNA base modification enzyme with NMAD domain